MPSRRAASDPSTTVGWVAVASLRKMPSARVAAQGVEQVGFGGDHGDAAGLLARGCGRCGGRWLLDVTGGRGRFDAADAADHVGGGGRQLAVAAEDVAAGRHLQEVGAELVELGQQVGPAGGRDADHGHHGGDADGDPEGGEQRCGPA